VNVKITETRDLNPAMRFWIEVMSSFENIIPPEEREDLRFSIIKALEYGHVPAEKIWKRYKRLVMAEVERGIHGR